MADATDKKKEKEGEEAPPKKSSKMLFIIIGGVVALLLIGGGAFFFLSKKSNKKDGPKEDVVVEEEAKADEHEKPAEKDSHKDAKETKGKKGKKEEGPIEIFAMEPFLVNLQDNIGSRYLKVSVNLEMDSLTAEEAKSKTAQIRDSIIILLSSKGYADVGAIQGKYQLRDEIGVRVNQILTKGKVKAVYFTDFVIQ